MHLSPDGKEGLALALEWLAKQVRLGLVLGISLEVSGNVSRMAVTFVNEEPDGPPEPSD